MTAPETLYACTKPYARDFRWKSWWCIMVNNTYCQTIHRFAVAATFRFNQNLASRHMGGTLSGL